VIEQNSGANITKDPRSFVIFRSFVVIFRLPSLVSHNTFFNKPFVISRQSFCVTSESADFAFDYETTKDYGTIPKLYL
jgi:hypothetical protein